VQAVLQRLGAWRGYILGAWRGYVIVIALVLAGAAFAQSSAGHRIMVGTGLSEAAPSFASLSFSDPNQLPLQLTSTRASVRVPFVIANADRLGHTYRWRVVLVRGLKTSQLTAGTTVVKGRASVSVPLVARIDCVQGRVGVEVQLLEPAESIEVWLTCSPQRGNKR
jgi:hypothetical protein